MFGVIVKGEEQEWARHFPARLCLRMGRRLHNDYPFTLINDRFREEVFSAGEFDKARNLSRGVRFRALIFLIGLLFTRSLVATSLTPHPLGRFLAPSFLSPPHPALLARRDLYSRAARHWPSCPDA
jgi:hypothetical protein